MINHAATAAWVFGTLIAVATLWTGRAAAQIQLSAEPDLMARPALIAERQGFVPGRTNTLAVTFAIEKGWHLYYPGQNDTGFAPAFDLTLPEGFTAGDPIWPAPQRYVSPGEILDHIYEDRLTVLLPIDISENVEPGRNVTITARTDWLVCKDVCIPEDAEVSITLPLLEADASPAPTEAFRHIALTRRLLPIPLSPGQKDFDISLDDGVLVIEPNRRFHSLEFYPAETSARIDGLLQHGVVKSGKPLRLPLAKTDGNDGPTEIRGVLAATEREGLAPRLYELTQPVGP